MSRSRTSHQATGRDVLTMLLALAVTLCAGGGLMAGLAMPFVAAAGSSTNALVSTMEDLPEDLGFTEPSERSVLLANDGSILASFYAENRVNVSTEEISKHMRDAAIAIEDRRFFEHGGVDVRGTLRALFSNATDDGFSGGSTITQQYVKNALLEEGRIANDDEEIRRATEQTIARKINEARYSLAIEKTMSKDDILTGYLNLAQFGPSQYGVEVAAQHYFSKSAKDLNIVESATLAGITQNPTKWDPVRNPENNTARRDVVLDQMLKNGFISQEEHDQAEATPLESYLHVSDLFPGCGNAGPSSYFCEYVVKDILRDESWGKDRDDRIRQLYRGGLVVHTTLDPGKQKAAWDAVTGSIPVHDESNIQMAMSAVEPKNGNIMAMVQNTNYGVANETDKTMTQVNLNVGKQMGGGSGYQAGSTFKIFTLVEWIRQGHSPLEVLNGNGGVIPGNTFHGSCVDNNWPDWDIGYQPWGLGMRNIINAAQVSSNGVFVRMGQQLDLCAIADVAKEMGASSGDEQGWTINPTILLGTTNVTPLSMATSAATLANDGVHCDPLSYTKIEKDGATIATTEPKCKKILEPDVARQTNQVLKAVTSPNGSGAKAIIPGWDIAGKTGTSNMHWHSWYVSYTTDVGSAIWQGHMEGNIPQRNVRINGRYYAQVFGEDLCTLTFGKFARTAFPSAPAPFPMPTHVNTPPRNATPQIVPQNSQTHDVEDDD